MLHLRDAARPLLYDHQRDPNEWTDLAADRQYAPVIDRLAKALPAAKANPPR